jgi:hypothetical protein
VIELSIEDVLRMHDQELRRLPNVTGVGIGQRDGEEVIIVFVKDIGARGPIHSREAIPETLEGYPVEIRKEIRVG